MIPSLPYPQGDPSQTAGPYVHIGLIPHQAGFDIFETNFSNVLVGPETKGERIRIEGRIFDGTGAAGKDVLVEIWQANAAGRYNHPADRQGGKPLDPAFRGWGRQPTDFETGLYRFETIKPGRVPAGTGTSRWRRTSTSGSPRAASISGCTRACISPTRRRPTPDPVLNIIEQPVRRETLIAARGARRECRVRVRHPPPGRAETVFFDV